MHAALLSISALHYCPTGAVGTAPFSGLGSCEVAVPGAGLDDASPPSPAVAGALSSVTGGAGLVVFSAMILWPFHFRNVPWISSKSIQNDGRWPRRDDRTWRTVVPSGSTHSRIANSNA